MEEMPKTYDPQEVEPRLIEKWIASGSYRRTADKGVGDCTVTIPPPNVTGVLHMGHALDDTIQDTLVRYHRMRGYSTRWILGTDHAGISTQTKVDKKLKSEGVSRLDIGREKFIEACWDWTHEYGGIIVDQIKRMGCSIDFDDEKFTMDADYALAVRKVFCDWYHDGLIYRGKRIVNWCPACTTAISDDEAEYRDEPSHLWHLRYPLKEPVDGVKYIVVATTRPETMLGDTGVAVSPSDPEKEKFIGKTVVLPIVDREIPIFADWHVDAEFGSGFVKVTPAHDPNDYAMGQTHGLPQINIFDEHAVVVDGYGEFTGMDRDEARAAVVAWFEEHGLLDHIDDHRPLRHALLPLRQAALEPWLSEQWFVAVDTPQGAGDRCGDATARSRSIRERWTQTYHDVDGEPQGLVHLAPAVVGPPHPGVLLRGLRVGRRLHGRRARVPEVRFDPRPPGRGRAGHLVLEPAVDVRHAGLARRIPSCWRGTIPTTALVTARDIIALWVARMVMSFAVLYLDEIPLRGRGHLRHDPGQGRHAACASPRATVLTPMDLDRPCTAPTPCASTC